MSVDSHIQIPKFILKQFCVPDKSGRVYNLRLQEKKIYLTGPSKLGTESGYYSEDTEQYFNQGFETPFSKLAASVRHFINSDNNDLQLPVTMETDFKRFVKAQMIRSGLAIETMCKSSYTADFCTPQENHDFLVLFASEMSKEKQPLFENYSMVILINKTSTQYVVPQNCFYTVLSHGIENIVVPISPICALSLVPSELFDTLGLIRESRIGYIVNDCDIVGHNYRALLYEYIYNHSRNGFIAAAREDELHPLLDILRTNERELDAAWKKARE